MYQHVTLDPSAADPRTLLTPPQAARYLGVGVGTLANYRSAGQGPPYVKIGALVRYRLGALDAWVDASGVTPKVGAR